MSDYVPAWIPEGELVDGTGDGAVDVGQWLVEGEQIGGVVEEPRLAQSGPVAHGGAGQWVPEGEQVDGAEDGAA